MKMIANERATGDTSAQIETKCQSTHRYDHELPSLGTGAMPPGQVLTGASGTCCYAAPFFHVECCSFLSRCIDCAVGTMMFECVIRVVLGTIRSASTAHPPSPRSSITATVATVSREESVNSCSTKNSSLASSLNKRYTQNQKLWSRELLSLLSQF